MKVSIEEGKISFRVTPSDLATLAAGRDLDQRVCVGNHCFSYRITTVGAGTEASMEMAVCGFCLYVPKTALGSVKEEGGLQFREKGVTIALRLEETEGATATIRKAA